MIELIKVENYIDVRHELIDYMNIIIFYPFDIKIKKERLLYAIFGYNMNFLQ